MPLTNSTIKVAVSRNYNQNSSKIRDFSNPRNFNQRNNISVAALPVNTRSNNANPRSLSNQAYQSPRNLSAKVHNTNNFAAPRNSDGRNFSANRAVNAVSNENNSRVNRRF